MIYSKAKKRSCNEIFLCFFDKFFLSIITEKRIDTGSCVLYN